MDDNELSVETTPNNAVSNPTPLPPGIHNALSSALNGNLGKLELKIETKNQETTVSLSGQQGYQRINLTATSTPFSTTESKEILHRKATPEERMVKYPDLKKQGLTQAQMGRKLGVSQQQVAVDLSKMSD